MKPFELLLLIFLITLLASTCRVTTLNNGLALTPPMGWMSWERYRCNIDCRTYPDECISEKLFSRMGELLISEGYKAKGYEYIIIDDCWMEMERDSKGRLQADAERFPSGIKKLADFLHEKGLKIGIYQDYGTKTCAGYPGMMGHLIQDAMTFAEWQIDYVKIDGCFCEPELMDRGYTEFGHYLNCSKRPMVYSCSWPAYQEDSKMMPNYAAIAEACNMWRNFDDIQDSFESLKRIIKHFAEKQDIYTIYAGPGHWNDPDMLIIGNFGLSVEQSKLQMAVWAILAAPLIMSVDLGNMRPEFKEILQNEAVIAVNQDPLGIQGHRLYKICQPIPQSINTEFLWNQNLAKSGLTRCHDREHMVEVWVRPITPVYDSYHSYAIAFVSFRTVGLPFAFSATLENLGLYSPEGYLIQDLFEPKDPGFLAIGLESTITVRVKPTGVVLLKATVYTKQK